MTLRRVVVTGIGMVSPLGASAEHTWKRILAGESGAVRVTEFDVSDIPAQIACRIPVGDGTDGTFNADDWMEPKEQRKVDPFIVYSVAAADQALADADWHPETDEDQCATGVLVGSGIGGIEGIVEAGSLGAADGDALADQIFHDARGSGGGGDIGGLVDEGADGSGAVEAELFPGGGGPVVGEFHCDGGVREEGGEGVAVGAARDGHVDGAVPGDAARAAAFGGAVDNDRERA